MKTLFEYLKSKRRAIIMTAAACVSATIVLLLYDLPIQALWLAVLLFFEIMVFPTIYDIISFTRRNKRLCQIKEEIKDIDPQFPVPDNLTERNYEEIIRILCKCRADTITENAKNAAMMTEYYTTWAHQTKTPIAAMRLLLEDSSSLDSKELSSELRKIEQYVDMAMAYARLGSESSDYVIRKFELDGIIKQAVRNSASAFIHKKIRLEYSSVNVSVLTDEKWLLFVIEQILSNSLKYTKSGGYVKIYMKQPYTLAIADNGIGIAAEDVPRIFDNGFTGYNGRKDKKASGIGLHLCKLIITRLHHEITAFSKEGEGTEICLFLGREDLQTE